MYRRAVFKRIEYGLSVGEIRAKMPQSKRHDWKEPDKNKPDAEIDMSLEVKNIQSSNGNCRVVINTTYQYRYGRGLGYTVTSDLISLIFLTKNKLLVVLGRDDSVSGAVREVSNIRYPNRKGMKTFSSIQFDKDLLVKTIRILRKDDSSSWCQDYNAVYGARLYKEKMTKSNFALVDGKCVLDDRDAIDAIKHATHISPVYKYYTCPKLEEITHNKPKAVRFNGFDGVVSTSTAHDLDSWHGFATFLVKSLELA